MRTKGQKYWDQFVLLDLFGAVSAVDIVGGNLKAQKLTFLLELYALRKSSVVGHYRFFRYQMGPYSPDLANDIRELETEELLSRSGRHLTPRGVFLHDYVAEMLSGNADLQMVTTLTSEVATSFGKKSGAALMNMVYGMRVPVFDLGREMKVLHIPSFLDILDPVHTPNLREIQPLSAPLGPGFGPRCN